MKKLSIITLSVLALFIASCKKTVDDPTPMDYVSYFSFNGNTNDVKSGTSATSFLNVKLTKDKNGKENSAYLFSGNSLMEFPLPSAKNIFTYSVWASPTVAPFNGSLNTVFSVGSQGGDQLISLSNGYSNINGWSLTSYNSDVTAISFDTGIIPEINTWHHLAITRDDEYYKAYYNGKLLGTKSVNGKKPGYGNGTPKFYIGNRHTGQGFTGIIDELRIYDRALTEQEIQTLYTNY